MGAYRFPYAFLVGVFALLIVAIVLPRFFPKDDDPAYTEQPREQKVDTQDLEVRAYLVEKYNPGTVFGFPRSIDDREVAFLVETHSQTARFIKDRFQTRSDYDVYTKIRQFQTIMLTKTDTGYDFVLRDGGGCSLVTYAGKITITEGKISHEEAGKLHESRDC